MPRLSEHDGLLGDAPYVLAAPPAAIQHDEGVAERPKREVAVVSIWDFGVPVHRIHLDAAFGSVPSCCSSRKCGPRRRGQSKSAPPSSPMKKMMLESLIMCGTTGMFGGSAHATSAVSDCSIVSSCSLDQAPLLTWSRSSSTILLPSCC